MFGAVLSPIYSTPSISKPLFCSLSCSHKSPNGRNLKASIPDPPLASRIFVRNLSYSVGEATLVKLFSKFGLVAEIKLAKHEKTNRSKGYAFIQYTCQDDAVSAIEQMDHEMINGRVVYAEIAKPLNAGFAYPRSLGPPSQQNLDADAVHDHLEMVVP